MCACAQPARCRATISLRPWTVVRALPWGTRTSGRLWAFDKPHPTQGFSCVQADPLSPTSWPSTTRACLTDLDRAGLQADVRAERSDCGVGCGMGVDGAVTAVLDGPAGWPVARSPAGGRGDLLEVPDRFAVA